METHGILPIVAATFTEHGAFDEDSFQGLIQYLVKTGVQGLTLFGLATEFYKLTDDERSRMSTLFLRETAGNSNIIGIVSITDHSKEIAKQRAQLAESQGADAIMLLPPFFLHPSEDAIFEHVRAVASAVSVPIIIQYAPNQTGVSISPSLFIKLQQMHKNIQCIKVETQPPGRYVTRLIAESEGSLSSLVGYAGIQMPDVLDRGAKGIQPGCSFSEIYVELYQMYQTSRKQDFLNLFHKLLPYISYWMQGIELIIKVEKTILKRRGIIQSDFCRSPGYRLDDAEIDMIEGFLEEFGDILQSTHDASIK